jgi:hypothetical protein
MQEELAAIDKVAVPIIDMEIVVATPTAVTIANIIG